MKKIKHNEEGLKSFLGSDEYFNLYESLEKPGHYFCDTAGDPMIWYHILNRTGVVDYGEGIPQSKVAEPVSIGPFWSQMCSRFKTYVFNNFLSEHIPHEKSVHRLRAWYKFKNFKPEKWLEDFIAFLKDEEVRKYKNDRPEQLTLF